MIGTFCAMHISKNIYKGYLSTQKESLLNWDDYAFEQKFAKVAFFPIDVIFKMINIIFYNIGLFIGNRKNMVK